MLAALVMTLALALLGAVPASAQTDTTPPTLKRGEIDDLTMTLVFSEALDEDSVPEASAFRLQLGRLLYNGGDFPSGWDLPGFPRIVLVAFDARGEVAISGDTVVIDLLRPLGAVSGRSAQLTEYDRNATANKLRDLAGNEVRNIPPPPDVHLTNLTPPRPWRVTVNRAKLTLTFENRLNEDSMPAASAFTVKVGGSEVSLTNDNPVEVADVTVTLTLVSAVTEGQSVEVRYAQPGSGGKLQDRDGNAVKTFPFKAAENRTDSTAPGMREATLNPTTMRLRLIYDEELDTDSRPAPGDFTVTVAGGHRAVSSVAVSGTTVTLTLASAITRGQRVTVTYSAGTNPIRDTSGNEAANFSGRFVSIHPGWPPPPLPAIPPATRPPPPLLPSPPTPPPPSVFERAVPLLPAASHPHREGVVRVINRSEEAGEVSIVPIDDAGTEYGPLTLRIGAHAAVHFSSRDLEEGNAERGLLGGVGEGDGDWRLEIASVLDLEVLAYVRAPGGALSSLHHVVPEEEGVHRVVFFNPASNASRVSGLRLVNPGEEAAAVRISGIDDAGEAGESAVALTLAPGTSRSLSAQALETGDGEGLTGALGDGEGKWRLRVSADRPIRVMSLLASGAHLANVSTAGEVRP